MRARYSPDAHPPGSSVEPMIGRVWRAVAGVALVLQVPIAHYADRGPRVRLALIGAVAWSLFSFATGLAFSVDGTGRVHSGTNPAARADALKRVPAWFER